MEQLHLHLRVNDPQPQMFLEAVKVAIVVQQRIPLSQAEGRNEAVDRLPNGQSFRAEKTIVVCSIQRYLLPAAGKNGQARQFESNLPELPLIAESLQDLAENQVGKAQFLGSDILFQPLRPRIRPASQVINPNGGVNDRNTGSTNLDKRDCSRSPSHWPIPRSFRIASPCRCNRRAVRREASTASRLVFAPEFFITSASNSSSISMLVRMFASMCKNCINYVYP